MAKDVLELVRVTKRYRRFSPNILDEVSLRLRRGELATLRGRNGSGKSTLLRVAGGFSRPTAGRVVRHGGGFGFVPDRAAPPSRMSARGYLTHLGRMAGMGRGQIATSIEEVSGRLGLAPGLDAAIGTLSRGNLRKVLLTQCLIRPAELMVLDEPFTALDADAETALTGLIGERLGSGVAFLIATHTAGLPGSSWVLSEGRLVEDDAGSAPNHADDVGDHSAAPPGEVFLIDLAGPATAGAGEQLAGGGVQYRVPAGDVETFLQQAITDGARIRRVEPEPGR